MPKIKTLLSILFLHSFAFMAQAQLTNGIYAIFGTTLGSFTSQIFYAEAPMAAANFIGLAEGSLSSIDLPSGRAQKGAFYNGLTFHRVISGFVIQAGSPNGQGTDGPGYSFVDEFDPTLTHDSLGILSMANSGPHSNGSQFFITLAPTHPLDNIHIVFGKVIDGSNIVSAIGGVATDVNDKPLTNVVINSVQIVRDGNEALAFDVTTNRLPIVSATASQLSGNSATNLILTLPANTNTEVYISASANLTDWEIDASGYINSTGDLDLPLSTTNTTEYFTTAQITYPHIALLDPTPSSWDLTLTGNSFSDFSCTVLIGTNFSSQSYTSDFSGYASGSLSNLNYSVSRPYKLNFDPILNPTAGSQPLLLELDLYFSTATNGVVEGFYVPSFPSGTGFEAVTGTFNLSIP